MATSWSGVSDEGLVDRVQRGQVDAFGEIYARHAGRMGRFLRMVGIPPSDLDDLVADTFCRALDRIDLFEVDSGKRYLSYLYAIARNLAVDRIRYRTPELSLEELDVSQEPSDGYREDAIVDQIRRLEQVALIRRAMERLSPGDREILALAYDRQMTSREIMAVTGKPSISAVTTHVYQAMKRLRILVKESAGEAAASFKE
jgi:RNA polymerase sigma-70 factor (ECF subfamily)